MFIQRRVIPGFTPTLLFTWAYLGILFLIPLVGLLLKSTTLGWSAFWTTASSARALASYRLSFGAALAAAGINAVFGLLLAWVLVGRPFHALGIRIAFTPLGIIVALTFIGLPFVVRTVEPILESLAPELEEAAAVLGARRLYTFRRVIFPAIFPALLTGSTLAFARAVGEYGSIVFISGNMPMRTEITPLLIVTKLEQYDYVGATTLAVVMLAFSFLLLLLVNLLQRWSRNSLGFETKEGQ